MFPNSMLAEDIKPSRLERSKQMINRMVDRMSNDKIGLIVFAGDAYTQIPITDDYPSVKMFLAGAGPDIVSKQGTAIGSAIELAVKSFSSLTKDSSPGESVPSQAIVVITDGENHEDDAVGEAKKAWEAGIRVYRRRTLAIPTGYLFRFVPAAFQHVVTMMVRLW